MGIRMKTTYIFLITCAIILGANQVTEAQVTAQRKGSMHKDIDFLQYLLPRIIGKDKDCVATNTRRPRPLAMMMPAPQTISEKETKLNPVPMVVFGFVGVFAGAWIGHSINHSPHMPGEPPEIFTKGTLIGAGVGLISGVTLGYFLGKKEPKKDKQKNYLRLEAY